MRGKKSNEPRLRQLVTLVCGLVMLLLASPLWAATLDEIISMHDAGVPPQLIIEVIEATGLDEPLDVDSLVYLAESGVDSAVLDFLIDAFPVESGWEEIDDARDSTSDSGNHPNWAGGQGFHHGRGGTGYNPLRDQNYDSGYWEGPGYRNDYYDSNYRVTIYEPPVYSRYNRPYYRAYRVPRVYRYYPDYSPGHYTYPSPYWDGPRHHRYRADSYWYPGWGYYQGRGGDFGLGWRYDGRRHHWDSSLNVWWRSNDFNIRIGF